LKEKILRASQIIADHFAGRAFLIYSIEVYIIATESINQENKRPKESET